MSAFRGVPLGAPSPLRRAGGVLAAGRLPIVVGGSHYYVESLLFETLIGDGAAPEGPPAGEPVPEAPVGRAQGPPSPPAAPNPVPRRWTVREQQRGGVMGSLASWNGDPLVAGHPQRV